MKKLKKIVGVFIAVVLSLTCLCSVSVSAENATPHPLMLSNGQFVNLTYGQLGAQQGMSTFSTQNVNSYYLGGSWSDSMKVEWSEGNSTSYHTLSCAVSEVYYSAYAPVSSYTNRFGTYDDVYLMLLDEDTLYGCWEVWNTSSGYERYTTDVFGLSTPRRLDAFDIQALQAYSSDECYVVYDLDTDTIIDLYSPNLNILWLAGWTSGYYTI
jgi:hypothetical protein